MEAIIPNVSNSSKAPFATNADASQEAPVAVASGLTFWKVTGAVIVGNLLTAVAVYLFCLAFPGVVYSLTH